MIYSLRGTLLTAQSNFIVVECCGVGYKCLTSEYTKAAFAGKLSSEITLYTHMNVRQDAVDLFGFADKNELDCFKLLTSVSGVGPKAALAILSQFSFQNVAAFVSSGNSKALTEASGIGVKTAQRIVLELKDKLNSNTSKSNSNLPASLQSFSKNISEAAKALEVLGYSTAEVMPILCGFDGDLPVEQLIGQGLKFLAKGVNT